MEEYRFSTINILGLSAGLACCILIAIFIQQELQCDKFNTNPDNIYRVASDMEIASGKSSLAVTPVPWAPPTKKDSPEVKEYVHLLKDEKCRSANQASNTITKQLCCMLTQLFSTCFPWECEPAMYTKHWSNPIALY